MIEHLLEARLKPVWRRRWLLSLMRQWAACWAVAAAASALVLLGLRWTGWTTPLAVPILALATVVATAIVGFRTLRRRPDLASLARELEQRDPSLGGRLATALEQRREPGGSLNFLQQRLIIETVEASFRANWSHHVSTTRLAVTGAAGVAAFGLWMAVIWTLKPVIQPGSPGLLVRVSGLEVIPGNAELERGTSLVVLARFGDSVPPSAQLVLRPANGQPQTLPLTRSLGDPVFGGTVPEVTTDLTYQIEYSGRRSPEYRIRVFEHPRLIRADADLQYPHYTGLAPKRIEDTRRISAVEGTWLDLGLQLNKPVVRADLLPRGNSNAPNTPIALGIVTNQAQVALRQFALAESGAYDLVLVDAEGRTNKTPAQIVLDVIPNRVPELKLAQPRGDQTPSALQEVKFNGSVWDDFGVLAYGLAYAKGDTEPVFLQLGTNVPSQEKRTLNADLALEDLGVSPDDLVSWFLWADDLGPDGQVRRTRGDLFFGEIRPFDEVFRQGSSSGGESQQQQQQDGSPTSKLAELQKQILNATWKLERERAKTRPAQHARDVAVVTESQSQALDQARELGDAAADPRAEMMWGGVTTAMERALAALVPATNTTSTLGSALAAERAAYQALLKLREREFQVTRGRNSQQGGGGGEQMRQQQLDQLELTEDENRYETQRDAQAQQPAERQEQLQVLNRLSELARRQEDLNERLKELQAQLQAADTEKEREEIRRQLKRLQEEQRQMLADADELQQRMNRAENQSRFAEQRRQLEQTRNELQRAADAAEQGSPSQALASGTRAQEQLQQMRDQVKQDSASQFAEELRSMRQEAREIARQQEALGQQLKDVQRDASKRLSAAEGREQLAQQLLQQQSRLTNLVSQATEISQAAEASEPLVSRQLYDTLRQLSQDDAGVIKQAQEQLIRQGQMTRSLYERLQDTAAAEQQGKALQLMEDLVREGLLPQAGTADQEARRTLARLQQGVEKAAESVLGDDTRALERAQQELEALASQLEQEIAQATPPESAAPGAPRPDADSASPTSPSSQTAGTPPGQTPGASAPSESGTTPGATPGGEASSERPTAQSSPNGRSPGGREGRSESASPSTAGTQPGSRADRNARNAADGRGTGPGGFDLETLEQLATGATRGGAGRGGGPILGEDFAPWSDRLREVEEMIDDPGLRSQVATARERARLARLEARRELKKPDWAVVRLQVVQPLVEVQQQIREELRRRNPGDTLVPIDRDPVPSRYAELVRRYYEQLGKE